LLSYLWRIRQVLTRETITTASGYDFGGESNIINVHTLPAAKDRGGWRAAQLQTVRGVGYVLRKNEEG
jgi:DNA-binding response OmpR family regulator